MSCYGSTKGSSFIFVKFYRDYLEPCLFYCNQIEIIHLSIFIVSSDQGGSMVEIETETHRSTLYFLNKSLLGSVGPIPFV